MAHEMMAEAKTAVQPQIVIVTGYSGAGKSTVLRALEDVGFFCVDNLPIALLDSFFQLVHQSKINGQRLALGIDIRGGLAIEDFIRDVRNRFAHGAMNAPKIFFLRSSPAVLLKRFQETRRKHPLADAIDMPSAIQQEQDLLQPLMSIADLVLDTDQLNIHQLRSFVRSAFSPGGEQRMVVSLVSFGFKYGAPLESNFLYDVRSLPNPYFVPALKHLRGIDSEVAQYLFAQPDVIEYWDKLVDFVCYSIKKSHAEGRFFMNIAIGCTGGKHRSVAFVQKLAQEQLPNVQFIVEHRDINRDSYNNKQEAKEVVL
ncbi:MAG: RNase adapter RapZ [Candidatus Dependentiae bacterium]|nr:RNase adapter RapZ [Candidatus Dependentiae bacterium]